MVFTLAISILGSIFGVICLALYGELRRSPKTIMAKFKLHPEKTENDFRMMMYANGSLTLFMAVLALGINLGAENLVNMAYIGQTLSAFIVVDIIGSWVFRYT